MTRTGNDAVAWARNQAVDSNVDWHRLCLMFTRSCFDVGALYKSAEVAYYNTNKRHMTWPPPRAVPVWWTNGDAGHVAISTGNGYCYSTDFKRYGKVDRVMISSIAPAWGQTYRGWSEDINEVKVYVPEPTLDASDVAHAAKTKSKVAQGTRLKKAVADEVGAGDMRMDNAILGDDFRERYRLVQRKYLRKKGITNPPARDVDGIPGIVSLSWLGNRHKFEVRP